METIKDNSITKQPGHGDPSQNEERAGTMASTDSDVKPEPEKRVRLSCDIERRSHRKLKMTAAARGKTILQMVESLIEKL